MKQLTVISGKGGTGKTSITAAFASLTENAVFADCDVDAADLHLILKPRIKKTMMFHGLNVASIKKNLCIDCKKCYESCQFDAIDEEIILSHGAPDPRWNKVSDLITELQLHHGQKLKELESHLAALRGSKE